jgi:hypothetical protein
LPPAFSWCQDQSVPPPNIANPKTEQWNITGRLSLWWPGPILQRLDYPNATGSGQFVTPLCIWTYFLIALALISMTLASSKPFLLTLSLQLP